MPEEKLREIADSADMIVRGYAFTRKGDNISVLNLNDGTGAMLLSPEGKLLETNMDPIEQVIVLKAVEKRQRQGLLRRSRMMC